MIGKSEAYVFFMLQLTRMSGDARTIAEKGWLNKGVAWQIARLKDPAQQTEAANALARPNRTKLVTESGAKHYIRDNFGDSAHRLSKQRVKIYGDNEYKANWKHHLVRLNCDQFEAFKKIVRGRTETDVLAEAVDVVMRQSK